MLAWWSACASPPAVEAPLPESGAAPVTPTTVGALVFDGPPPKDLWMISIDTLRRDHVDPLATDGIARMPFLAARMAEGVVLADHQQCASWTLHSLSCTLLGRAPEDTGWLPRLDGGRTPAPDGQRTLAVRLREVGYDPLVASSNGWFGPDWNSLQGYGEDLSDRSDALGLGRDGLAALRAQVADDPDRPWFLHLHVKEPHSPYDPPEAYLDEVRALPPVAWDLTVQEEIERMRAAFPTLPVEEQELLLRHQRARYDAEIRWLDDQLGQLWAEMSGEGLLDDALVVLWSDHGEAILDHADWGHGRWLYREESDAFVSFWADHLRPGVWTGPTHGTDLVPTVLAALGVDPDEDLPGAVVGTADPDRARLAATVGFDGPTASVTRAGQKLVYWFDGRVEQYDLRVDPQERQDRWDPADPGSQALWEVLRPHVERLDALAPERAVLP